MASSTGGNRSAIFRRLLFSYLSILLIPIIFGSYAYREAVSVAKRASIDSRLSMLEHSKNLIDQNLREIDEMVLQISLDPDLSALRYVEAGNLSASDIIKLMNAKKKIAFFRVTNDFKRRFYVFYTGSQVVLSSNRINTGLEFHYNSFLSYPNLDFTEWKTSVLDGAHAGATIPAGPVLADENEYRVVTYLRSLPPSQSGMPTGLVAFLIDENVLLDLLQGSTGIGHSILLDAESRVIAQFPVSGVDIPPPDVSLSNPQGHLVQVVDGVPMIVTYTTSQYNGWKYVSVVPAELVLNRVAYIRKLTLGVVLSALALGVLSAFLLSYIYAKPLRAILGMLHGTRSVSVIGRRSELSYLASSVSGLIEENRELQTDVRAQSGVLRSMFIGQLLKGAFGSEHELIALRSRASIRLSDHGFVVVLLVLREDGAETNAVSPDAVREAIESVAQSQDSLDAYEYPLGPDEWALLVNFRRDLEGGWRDATEQFIAPLHSTLENHISLRPRIGIGSYYERSGEIHYSYREARFALEGVDDASPTDVLWYTDIAAGGSGYYYPVELEIRLINNAKSGNRDEVSDALDLVYKRNYLDARLTPQLGRVLSANMYGSLIKLATDFPLPEDVAKMIHAAIEGEAEGEEESFASIRALYAAVSDAVDAAKKSHNGAKVRGIIDIIHRRYAEWDLSPRRVAEELAMSEHYLSHFFKEQTGESFSLFLERTRIEAACALLAEGKSRVQDAALHVGYANVYTFRRAFKRVTGVVPTDYA